MKQSFAIARKELNDYFSSPTALIFIGVFLIVTLFTFFWVDAFWARDMADVRPLFRWVPVLTIFLVATLTMRQWSEEQQTGTLEILLTMPMRLWQVTLGKFLAVLLLVVVALLLTLFLPITVALLGNLDPGPVVGGYVAAILMASAYIAMGLFMSSRTDKQLVALILTVLLGMLFHLIGTMTITGLVGNDIADILRAFSTTSRFESIERGVIDIRDLLYYASLTVIFLSLNIVSLDGKRWSAGARLSHYRLNRRLMVLLIASNLLVFNGILSPANTWRLDLTANREYSLSPVTRDILRNLQEPLLIRGYFSEQNHPLLAPLIPGIRDMLREYEIAAGDKLTVELIDPIDNPEMELEANQTYGIRPTPLQTMDRSGTALLNVYFDILIRYGDQSEVLNFGDLIEVNQYGSGDIEVRLRNLEYDLTSSIKKVVLGFQSIDAVLAGLAEPATLTLYTTPDTLPDALAAAPDVIATIASEIQEQSEGMFLFQSIDVDDPNDQITPQMLLDIYQIQPMATNIFAPDTFYLHMVLQSGNQAQVIYPSGEISETEIRGTLEAALKRMSSGFLHVVGIWTPPDTTQTDPYGQPQPSLSQYNTVSQILRENYEVRLVDLSTGAVPGEIDVLVVIAPQNISDYERYAIDQYLMRGGSVFIATNNYRLAQSPYDGWFALEPITDGLGEMLAAHGISVGDELVLDLQNDLFITPVQSNTSGFTVAEFNAPFFIDVRADGMNQDSAILQNLPAITLNWSSPVTVGDATNTDHTVTTLLESTSDSWLTTSLNIQPNFDLYPDTGFPVEGEQQSYPLAIAIEGSFGSFFGDRPSPFEVAETSETPAQDAETQPSADTESTNALAALGTIERSPQSARLIVVGSAEFLNDNLIQFSQSFSGDRYLNTLQFIQNSVDWFVRDVELASIRSRGSSTRVLNSLSEGEETLWEVANYLVALIALSGLGIIWWWRRRAEKPMILIVPETAAELVES